MKPSRRPLPPVGLVACLAAFASFGACLQRTIIAVDLAPITFESEAIEIDGEVDLCISRALRQRQWNVERHPYRVALGARASTNLESLARSAFRVVHTRFDGACGEKGELPWMTAEIRSANRDWDGIVGIVNPEPVDTGITLRVALYATGGEEIWATSVQATTRSPGPVLRPRRYSGARDFGVVLQDALREVYASLMTSPEVRAAFP